LLGFRNDGKVLNWSISVNEIVSPESVVAFWLEAGPKKWFTKDDAFDAEIRGRFLPTYEAAAERRLASWEATADGALALTIVLDQFSRNMFRGSARTFAADALARAVAGRAIARGFDTQLGLPKQSFFYLPFMHAENLADQQRCVDLARQADDANTLKFAEQHADIIRRFGRFPHRNALLGRATTAEEQAFLDSGGFGG
jgi:uncharacterized protein (DUF924 family)